MCMPHAPTSSVNTQRRERGFKPKKSVSFNKKFLEPDPNFKDERKESYKADKKSETTLEKLFSIFH